VLTFLILLFESVTFLEKKKQKQIQIYKGLCNKSMSFGALYTLVFTVMKIMFLTVIIIIIIIIIIIFIIIIVIGSSCHQCCLFCHVMLHAEVFNPPYFESLIFKCGKRTNAIT